MVSYPFFYSLAASVCSMIFLSCSAPERPRASVEGHAVEHRQKGGASLYLDPVPSGVLMQSTEGDATQFFTYLIGFKQGAPAGNEKEADWGRYIQFDLPSDLTALYRGDTLKPVFYQPKTKVHPGVDEGYVVFEAPTGVWLDTLIYQDSYGGWGTQYLKLNDSKSIFPKR